MIPRRDYFAPPLGGPTDPCGSLESLAWKLDGDRLIFSRLSPEPECPALRRVAALQPLGSGRTGRRTVYVAGGPTVTSMSSVQRLYRLTS